MKIKRIINHPIWFSFLFFSVLSPRSSLFFFLFIHFFSQYQQTRSSWTGRRLRAMQLVGRWSKCANGCQRWTLASWHPRFGHTALTASSCLVCERTGRRPCLLPRVHHSLGHSHGRLSLLFFVDMQAEDMAAVGIEGVAMMRHFAQALEVLEASLV